MWLKKRRLSLLVLLLFIPIITVSSATLISVQDTTAKVNQSFTVNVTCVPSEPIKAYEMKIRFDQRILSATSLTAGGFFFGDPVFSSPNCVINNTIGTITNIYALTIGKQLMVIKPGVLFTIIFIGKQNGTSTIGIYDAGVTNDTRYLSLKTINGSVTIDGVMIPDNDSSPPDNSSAHTDDPPAKTQGNSNDPDPLSWITQNLIIVLIIGLIIIFVVRSIFL